MNTVPLWVTLLGFAAPLITLAGSAVAFVIKFYQDGRARRRTEFFQLFEYIDKKDNPIATKVAAIYQLRQFPEHKDFIIRFCEAQRGNIQGGGVAAQSMIDEFDRTRTFLSKGS